MFWLFPLLLEIKMSHLKAFHKNLLGAKLYSKEIVAYWVIVTTHEGQQSLPSPPTDEET